jgi:hypothetical protein
MGTSNHEKRGGLWISRRRFCGMVAFVAAGSGMQAAGGAREDEEIERIDGGTCLERGEALVRYVALIRPDPRQENDPKASAPCYAARLVLGIDVDYAVARLDAAVVDQIARGRTQIEALRAYDALPVKAGKKRPEVKLDPFHKVALVNTYFLGKARIPDATARRIRDYVALWGDHRELTGYAREAWNYKLMMDASGFLAAEQWPELVDREGLAAPAILVATRGRLFAGFDEITKRNFSEYGAPIYMGVNLSAVRMLVDFARDGEMRKRAAMALDAMMVDIACTWNGGYNTGSASRAKYWESTDTGPDNMASTAASAWVWFGARRAIRASGSGWIHSFWMATPGTYQVPEMIVAVANERSKPFVHRSYVAAMENVKVHRMTYHNRNYSLCSQWDQAGDPTSGLYKEGRRHMLKWHSDKPSSTFAVCMENPARPYALQEKRANALGYGENAFAQYFQHEGTLLGLYAVAEKVETRKREFDYPYCKMYVPFPTTGSIVERKEMNGWVFCHNGTMLMAFFSAKPCHWGKRWGNNDMLWCEARRNGWILETSELAPFAGGGVQAELSRFAEAVLSKTERNVARIDDANPFMEYRTLSRTLMQFDWQPHAAAYVDQLKVDGKPVVFSNDDLHRNPWVAQKVGEPLVIRHGGKRLTFDFGKWERMDG